jgi:hypothetical protein
MKSIISSFILCAAFIGDAGCNIPLKQDTPQATIATLIKLYAAPKQTSRVTEIVDPVTTRATARAVACLSEAQKEERCRPNIKFDIYGGIHGSPTPQGCPAPPLAQCICGMKGSDAANEAASFLESDIHAGLVALHMSAETCSITDAQDLDAQHSVAKLNPFFWDRACSDITKENPLASVTIKCGKPEMSVTFILQNQASKWMVVGFDTTDETALSFMATGRKRTTDLNKDLK